MLRSEASTVMSKRINPAAAAWRRHVMKIAVIWMWIVSAAAAAVGQPLLRPRVNPGIEVNRGWPEAEIAKTRADAIGPRRAQ